MNHLIFLCAFLAGLVGCHSRIATDHQMCSHLYSAFWRVLADFAAEAGGDMHSIYTHLVLFFVNFFGRFFGWLDGV